MSTNFLNRRMDLIHSVVDDINYLTMDTSYPVKLAGLVIKLFTATQNYNKQQFVICNSDKEEILTITTDKIYDFAGRVINDSIGIEEAYKSEEDVYIKDDYVMVIIDFNDKNIHLCSQTNFKMFITAGVDDFCNFKLFDITGDTEVEGFDYPINVDEFDNAYNFEQKKVGHHSFLRHDEDDVVYQVPEIIGTGDDIERSMVPVANVENININRLNVSISQLTFPFINLESGTAGLDNVSSIMSYYTINGRVNDKFISEYCFTYDEIKSLKLCNKLTDMPNNQILTELNMIPEDKRNDYVYVVRANCIDNKYESSDLLSDVIVTAIDKNTKSFCNYMIFDNKGINCNNKNVSIPIKRIEAYYLIGNWWSSDNNNGFYFYRFTDDNILAVDEDQKIIAKGTIGIQIERDKKLITNNYYSNGNEDNNRSGSYYMDYINNLNTNISTHMTFRFTRNDIHELYTTNTTMKKLNRFIKFFANDDTGYYNHFIEYSLSPSFSNPVGNFIGLAYCTYPKPESDPDPSKTVFNTSASPICVVGIYPELFDKTIFHTSNGEYDDTNIHNFTSFYNDIVTEPIDDTNRTKYKYDRYDPTYANNYRNHGLAYELIDRCMTSGYYKEHDNKCLTANISNVTDENCKRYKYISNRSLDSTSFSNFVIKRNLNGDIDDLLMCSMVSVVIANCVNTPYDNTQPYNNAEMVLQHFAVSKSVKRAIQHIEISSDNKLIYHPNGINDPEAYNLYTIVNENGNNSNFLWEQVTTTFKTSSGSDKEGICYLYYLKGSNDDNKGVVHRLKYFYNNRYIGSDIIPEFDYFTDSIMFDRNKVENEADALLQKLKSSANSHMIIHAYLNQDMNLNETPETTSWQKFRMTSSSDSWYEILIDIVKAYHFFPYNIENASEDNKQTIINFNTLSFASSNTAKLTIGIDDMINYPAKTNNLNINNGTGFRLKDMINNDKIIYYQNSMVPYVTDIKDSNGSYVYTIRNYVNYIKNHRVDEFFYTDLFKYLNGVGIREEYYKDKSIYDFYNYVLTVDLSKPINDTTYLKINGDRAFFKKNIISKIHGYNNRDGKYYFTDENGNEFPLTVKDDNGITLNANIDIHNIFGYNESTLMDSKDVDKTENYINVEKVNMNVVETGLKRIYTISMSDGLYNTAMMPVNGSSDSIDTDTLNWNDLLLALNNDKRIDMLSESLMRIKSELNDYIVDNAQNISDIYSIEENNKTEKNAKSHDENMFDIDSPYYKEKNAEFDNAHNVYKFNYGYGFQYEGSFNKRESKNRGVIVFVSEGGFINRDQHGLSDPNQYTYSYDEHTKIYPKRMYISKDGLLCTKEYYDRELELIDIEKTNNEDYKTTIKNLEDRIAELEKRL